MFDIGSTVAVVFDGRAVVGVVVSVAVGAIRKLGIRLSGQADVVWVPQWEATPVK